MLVTSVTTPAHGHREGTLWAECAVPRPTRAACLVLTACRRLRRAGRGSPYLALGTRIQQAPEASGTAQYSPLLTFSLCSPFPFGLAPALWALPGQFVQSGDQCSREVSQWLVQHLTWGHAT